jgi:phospholipid/cholesterol/gamma-HCH transport system permease protein
LLLKFLDFIGKSTILLCDSIGKFTIFVLKTLKTLFTTKLKVSKVLFQMEQIGVNSFVMCILTGAFAGAVLVIQTYKGFKQFGGQQFIGPVLALTMARELGPVLTGFMVTARSASAIAAEIGTMRISEQIDALRTLRINVFQYLIVPRVLAGTLILPFLTIFCMIGGIIGGYLVATQTLGLSPDEFKSGIKELVELFDIQAGLIKAACFGFILTAVGTFKGYFSSGGAQGVGVATTQSVVVGSSLIIITNYFLALLLFGPK